MRHNFKMHFPLNRFLFAKTHSGYRHSHRADSSPFIVQYSLAFGFFYDSYVSRRNFLVLCLIVTAHHFRHFAGSHS